MKLMFIALLVSASAAAWALPPAPASTQDRALELAELEQFGEQMLTACLDCHRPGQNRGDVPLIEGQHRDYLHNQLSRFRQRHRASYPMTGLALGLEPEMIDLLADRLSQRPWQSAPAPRSPPAIARGRERVEFFACDSCHGDRFIGIGDIPRLAGQQPGYLARQLRNIAEGERFHPPTGIGVRIDTLTPEEMGDAAAYLHSLGAPPE